MDTMCVSRKVLTQGNGIKVPKKGDTVRVVYTGYVFDESEAANDCKGVEYAEENCTYTKGRLLMARTFDTNKGRGAFETPIGVGKVIRSIYHEAA